MPLPDSQLNHCKNQKGPAKLAGPFSALFSLPGLCLGTGELLSGVPPKGEDAAQGKRLCSWTDKKLPRVLADTGQ